MAFNLSTNIQSVFNLLQQTFFSMLDDISKTYNIDRQELVDRYMANVCCEMDNTNVMGPKKRGRKKKIKDDFIETEEYEYDGKTYLVDKNNIVYSNDTQKPSVLGKRMSDGRIIILCDDVEHQ
jgi:hypothetical protein